MKQSRYIIIEDVKFYAEYNHRLTNDGSTITAIISFLADDDLVLTVSLVYTWTVDGDADSEGRPIDCSHWYPKLNGRVEDIQLLSEKAPELFKQIPNEKIKSSDPSDVVAELEYFFEASGIVSE
jgi:hypothetical protein